MLTSNINIEDRLVNGLVRIVMGRAYEYSIIYVRNHLCKN